MAENNCDEQWETASGGEESFSSLEESSSPSEYVEEDKLGITMPGYGDFKKKLANILTPDVIRELVSDLGYQSDVTDDLCYEDEEGVGHVMVSKMEEAGDIDPRSVWRLIRSLEKMQHYGVARRVTSAYKKMVSVEPQYQGKTKIFIDGLRQVYREMIDSSTTVCFHTVKHKTTDVFVVGSLERLEEVKTDIEPEVWTTVTSHRELFEELYHRIIIEGEPGYGKTAMSIQLVHEWCEKEYDVDVLIFLRLREVGKLSLYQAIRLFALPKDCKLSEQDIYRILSSRAIKVVFILDGYDEFTNLSKEADIVKLIYMQILEESRIIITTRAHYMEDIAVKGVTRMRFAGFDEDLQRRYMAKALRLGPADVDRLMESFLEKSLLADMGEIPLFFAHFTHILATFPDVPNLKMVTGYMKYLLDSCFNSQLSGEDIRKVREDEVVGLARVAFESLKAVNRHYVWNLDAFQKTVGEECCDRFTRAGVLVRKGPRIKFFHSFFQEFLGALYMFHLVKSGNPLLLQTSLEEFRPKELKYMFLFGCGLNKDVATILINFFLPLDTYIITMRLCLLDVRRNVPPLLDAVRKICDMYLSIYIFESRLVHRSTINVLRIAAKHKIPVYRVWMIETFGTADQLTGDIELNTGITLPRLTTVRQIVIGTERGRELKKGEWIGLLKYAAYSRKIEVLDVYWCLLPFLTTPRDIPLALKSKSISIKWGTLLVLEHKLDLYTGKWQGKLNNIDMTEKEYEQEVEKFRERFRLKKWKEPLNELSDGFARLLKKTDPYE